jgi:hypothetical protein
VDAQTELDKIKNIRYDNNKTANSNVSRDNLNI